MPLPPLTIDPAINRIDRIDREGQERAAAAATVAAAPSALAPPLRALVHEIVTAHQGQAGTERGRELLARADELLDDETATEFEFHGWLVALCAHVNQRAQKARDEGREFSLAPNMRRLHQRVVDALQSAHREEPLGECLGREAQRQSRSAPRGRP